MLPTLRSQSQILLRLYVVFLFFYGKSQAATNFNYVISNCMPKCRMLCSIFSYYYVVLFSVKGEFGHLYACYSELTTILRVCIGKSGGRSYYCVVTFCCYIRIYIYIYIYIYIVAWVLKRQEKTALYNVKKKILILLSLFSQDRSIYKEGGYLHDTKNLSPLFVYN